MKNKVSALCVQTSVFRKIQEVRIPHREQMWRASAWLIRINHARRKYVIVEMREREVSMFARQNISGLNP